MFLHGYMLQEELDLLSKVCMDLPGCPALSSWTCNTAMFLQLLGQIALFLPRISETKLMARFSPGTLVPTPFESLSKGLEKFQELRAPAVA